MSTACAIPCDIAPFRLSGTVYGALLNHKSALTLIGPKAAQPPYWEMSAYLRSTMSSRG